MKLATIFLVALVSVAMSYGDNILMQDDPALAQEDLGTHGSFAARVLGRIAQKKRNNRREKKTMMNKRKGKNKKKVCSFSC